MPIDIPKDKWTGKIRTVTIGATAAEGGTRAKSVTLGGQTTLPYLHFEAPMPHRPVIGLEMRDRRPDDWSPLLLEQWGQVIDDPAKWVKPGEEAGADLIQMTLSLTDKDGNPNPRLQLGGEEKSPYEGKCIMVPHAMLDATPTPGTRTIDVFHEPFLS